MVAGLVKTNVDKLVKVSVVGEVTSASIGPQVYKITADGRPVVLPSVGGIRYNVRVGDLAVGWMADHVEPGVSIKNLSPDGALNTALNVLSCVGNEAIVVLGDAKGAKGVVVGKHGGIEHVMVDFQPDVLEKLVVGDKVMVKAFGVGLSLLEFPEVRVMNLDPSFLEAIDPKVNAGKLEIPVTHIVPAAIMGSGLGAAQTYSGDYDIQLFDKTICEKYGLEDLRLGDLIAIMDADHSYGRIYKTGAITIGIIVHTDCVISGHGPGVSTLFTSSTGQIAPKLDPEANIAYILKLRGSKEKPS